VRRDQHLPHYNLLSGSCREQERREEKEQKTVEEEEVRRG